MKRLVRRDLKKRQEYYRGESSQIIGYAFNSNLHYLHYNTVKAAAQKEKRISTFLKGFRFPNLAAQAVGFQHNTGALVEKDIGSLSICKFLQYQIIHQKAQKFNTNNTVTRIHNYCLVTGRGHSILRGFGLSRITFKNFADKGMLTGVRKSSW